MRCAALRRAAERREAERRPGAYTLRMPRRYSLISLTSRSATSLMAR